MKGVTFTLVLEGWALGVGYSVSRDTEMAWKGCIGAMRDTDLLELGSFSLLLACPQMSPCPPPDTPKKPLWEHPHKDVALIPRTLLSLVMRERSRLFLLAGHLEKEQVVCVDWPPRPGLDSAASARAASLECSPVWKSAEKQEARVIF